MPEWKDIKQYLEYLHLDEPIIGLNSLVQIPDHVTEDGKNVLKYKCRLCFVEMDQYSMVTHIVGRKHRQKYLELKRPDLVTWSDSNQKQPGLVARAKAAVVEKQEGWGTPEPLKQPKVYQGLNLRPSVQQQQPYYGQDVHRSASLDEEQEGVSYYIDEKYGHQPYPQENQHQRAYEEADPGGRSSRGDLSRGRLREEYEREPYSRGDRHMPIDVQEKTYHEGVPKNRFNDKDLRVHQPGGSHYQKEHMQSSQYGAYDDRKSAGNPVPMHGRSLHDEGKKGTVRERSWDKASEMQGYPHMHEPNAYLMEDIPAKRKKKSRFSDATAEEIAYAHMRHSKKHIPKEQTRGPSVRGALDRGEPVRGAANRGPPVRGEPVRGAPNRGPPVRGEPVRGALDRGPPVRGEPIRGAPDRGPPVRGEPVRGTPNRGEPVRAALDRGPPVRGEPVRGALDRGPPVRGAPMNQFVDSGSASHLNQKDDSVLDIFNNIEIENMEDARILKEKLCTVLKEFQASKTERVGGHTSHTQSVSDHRGVNPTDQRRDDPDSMYQQNRGFQDPRRYDDDRRGLQEYRDDPRAFRQDEDPRAPRHYADYPSSHPEARPYDDDPRGFPKPRGPENPQSHPERRRYDDDLRQKEPRYEEYPQASRADADLRSSQEARYYEDHYRGYGSMESERDWERSQESFGKSSGHFQSHALQDGGRMYGGRGQQRAHQSNHQPGTEELYDPFQPSSSPPPESSSSTSLDKIASTLLELVSRR
ncbi:ribosome-binding protein 1 isoform X2 [Danio aesculapii]|nr:ribosome-binding protein 1 isoform X2 [Danio aesculapii]